ncbi:hypothetical protein A4F89_06700 [Polynucleobacter asymbioticus]|jgi:hypothetical protein|uniref:hypothetical protein n=1 Tax=Polynucleobacter asymbioticus TaxID=576611 RepID=UPI0008FADC34|nr:hypothetical protein [Polynucleobacter asymbioticus]APB99038.1 hypothetical protein A4F89_06700 [Polynucleobacter asymbioticus]
MDIHKAAGYLVVAWVKDWNIRTLLNALGEGEDSITDEYVKSVNAQYPFMPMDLHNYIANHGKGSLVRTYLAEVDKKLSDAMWDSCSNEQRLKYVPYIKKMKVTHKVKLRQLRNTDRNEVVRAISNERTATASYRLSRQCARKSNGHDWFTVK